jgi:hypothetical protein
MPHGTYSLLFVLTPTREIRRSNQEWTIQRHRQCWAQGKEQRHTKQKQQHRKSKKMSNKDPTKKKRR